MLEYFEIKTVEQLRAIADKLRLQIVVLLQEHPMTVTQLGAILNIAPAKVHYHVRELEKVGLLHLVETREKGGVLEKYYEPIARDISVEKSLFLTITPDESLAATSAWFEHVKESFQRAFRTALEQKEEPSLNLGLAQVYITAEEQKQLTRQILELLKPYEKRQQRADEQAIAYALVSFPQAASPGTQARSEAIIMEDSWTVGFAQVRRSTLEKALAEGKRLRLKITGVCAFADDISADLADHAIEQFYLIGKLQASAAVRNVLMQKRQG